ncbi:MAG: MBL fold metallo-hydrolase [Acidimicrobiales bacterium]
MGSSYDPDLRQPCSGYLLESGATSVILDCGFGTFASFQELARESEVRAIVLSHAHRDHYGDLGDYLAWASATSRRIVVVASADTFGLLANSIDIERVERVVVNDDSRVWLDPFSLEFSSTTHQIPTLGVRVSLDERHVVYGADTGPGWRVPISWRRADLALLECTYARRNETTWPFHLSSGDVAELAREIDATTTLITHVPPHHDATEHLRLAQRAAPSALFVLAELGQRIVITPGELYE